MPGLKVGFQFDATDVQRLFERAPGAVRTRLRQLVEGAAIDVQREERLAAPIAVTGHLRRQIRYTFSPARLQATVWPDTPYAEAVEKGSRPRWVSVREGSPLRDWAKLKGINPYALQRSIARKGTKAHPFVEPTYDKMKPIVERNIGDGMSNLIEDLNHGRV